MDNGETMDKIKGQSFILMFVFISLVLLLIISQYKGKNVYLEDNIEYLTKSIAKEYESGMEIAFLKEDEPNSKIFNLTKVLKQENPTSLDIEILYAYIKNNGTYYLTIGNFIDEDKTFDVNNTWDSGSEEYSIYIGKNSDYTIEITKGTYNVITIEYDDEIRTIETDENTTYSGFYVINTEMRNKMLQKYGEFNYTIGE